MKPIDPFLCPASSRIAWVYFLQEEHGGPIKIGYAWRVLTRVQSAQTGNPRRLHLIGALPVAEDEMIVRGKVPKNTRRTEKEIHERFGHARIRGEWFVPTDALLHFIASLPRPEGA